MTTLAAISWDPFMIGILAVGIGVVILCGSVYLLLATNLGARLGFLVAVCGLAGWIFLMGIIWMVYGIGLIGRDPSWEVEEVISGEVDQSAVEDVRDLPSDPVGVEVDAPGDWEQIPAEELGDALAAADEVLFEDLNEVFTEVDGIAGTDDYTLVRAFERGGDKYPAPFGYDGKPFGFFHEARYIVIQVQPNLPPEPVDLNAPPEPREVDPNAPVYTVVEVRDLGARRLPPTLITIFSGIIFGVSAWQLHRRDLALMEMRESSAA